ncbi:MAG: glucose-1-phosphate thymidylyltransferase, partial [Alphaproteobacteria bacterium]|nr:glucose-1-phosphate thymidylyltransferase [Alphaproteobacteria bacterium]
HVEKLGRGHAWLDTGSHDGLLEASQFVHALQRRQGVYIACLEEIAFEQGFIDRDQLRAQGQRLKASEYGRYLLRLADSARA